MYKIKLLLFLVVLLTAGCNQQGEEESPFAKYDNTVVSINDITSALKEFKDKPIGFVIEINNETQYYGAKIEMLDFENYTAEINPNDRFDPEINNVIEDLYPKTAFKSILISEKDNRIIGIYFRSSE